MTRRTLLLILLPVAIILAAALLTRDPTVRKGDGNEVEVGVTCEPGCQ